MPPAVCRPVSRMHQLICIQFVSNFNSNFVCLILRNVSDVCSILSGAYLLYFVLGHSVVRISSSFSLFALQFLRSVSSGINASWCSTFQFCRILSCIYVFALAFKNQHSVCIQRFPMEPTEGSLAGTAPGSVHVRRRDRTHLLTLSAFFLHQNAPTGQPIVVHSNFGS